jgi:hypothetical protein
MGLFDLFRKPKPTVPLPQLCYDVAYFILPHYAYNDLPKLAEMCLNTPTTAGPFFYVMACQARESEPVLADGQRFRWHHGELTEGVEYFVLEYPTPPPADLSRAAPEGLPVLAPHFSAVLRERATGAGNYFILGQAPFRIGPSDSGTTLRTVLREGANCNLGPGPEPQLDAFLAAVRGALARGG